ncbi:MAG TPA: hypothetical protein V6C58_15235 [Allocoleopsis sp.]
MNGRSPLQEKGRSVLIMGDHFFMRAICFDYGRSLFVMGDRCL